MAAALSYVYSPQFFINRARLAQGILLRTGCIYDEIRNFSFLFKRHLAAQPRAHFGLGYAVPVHCALDLLRRSTGDNDQAIEALVAAILNQDSSLDNRYALRLPGGEFGHHFFFPRNDRGVDQGVEARESLRIGKHAGCKPPAINSSIGNYIATEFLHHCIKSLTPRGQHFVPKIVRLNQKASAMRQSLPDETLATGKTAGKPDF